MTLRPERLTTPGTAGGPRTRPVLRSALYEGTVVHARTEAAGGTAHRFSMRVAMLLLDTDELDAVAALHPLVRTDDGPAAVHLRRRDLLGDPDLSPADAARRQVARALGPWPAGPVDVLLHPRTWGWQFNPIACAFCHDGDGHPTALVAEVTNTPWHQRTTYVVGPPGRHVVAKAMHVSPFLPMDLEYRITYTAPGPRLTLAIDVHRDDGPLVLHTRLQLVRRSLDRAAIGRLLWRHPLMATRVSAGIYWQAARLRRRGAPFHPHPDRRPA